MNKKPTLFTSLSPALLHLTNLKDTIVVVIDVFRATSTIATALYNGAEKVIPVAGVEECKNVGSQIKNAVTAGEREGRVIQGLQYGNSPAEYPRQFIEGKTLVLTTTNGTKLLHMAIEKGCAEVVTGSFPNLSAVCKYLTYQNKNVVLGCSGWKDMFNLEDTLFAGAVIDRIHEDFIIHDDASLMAQQIYRLHENNLFKFIQNTTHWHRLAAYGLQKDLQYCISHDVADVLPIFKERALIAHEYPDTEM